MLCERELGRKHERRIEMGLSIAKFPPVRDLGAFDYKAQPSLDAKQIKELSAGRWVGLGETLLLLGPRPTADDSGGGTGPETRSSCRRRTSS